MQHKEGIAAGLFISGVMLFGAYVWWHASHTPKQVSVEYGTTGSARIVRVIDGDTVVVDFDDGVYASRTSSASHETVRLIGINAPESVHPTKPVQCFGHEASQFLKTYLPSGTPVRLASDPLDDDRDKYGRLLRYIYQVDASGATSTLVNAVLVSRGYAYAYTVFPFTHHADFVALQRAARAALRGLWSPDTCHGQP